MTDMALDKIGFLRALSGELDPEKLRQKFLALLLELQDVERGSIWVKRGRYYQCVEAAGAQSERIIGLKLDMKKPSVVGWVIENGKMTVAEAGSDIRHRKEVEDDFEIKSRLILCFPLHLRSGRVYGAVQIIDTTAGGDRLNLDQEYLELLQSLVDIGAVALSNSLAYDTQRRKYRKLKQAIEGIRAESVVTGASTVFEQAMKLVRSYASTDYPVLVSGESGTGKEVAAREIHKLSARAKKPFFAQNCSAIPDTLLESELFGYKKGAFTGANSDKKGLFQAAHGGTLFLDEIGEMDVQLQARLLRVLQEGEVKPLGGVESVKVDVRIISATNRDLEKAVADKEFREDLFYRLNVLPLRVPSLRERFDDIPLLADHFLQREAARMRMKPKKIAKNALETLTAYSWPGNIRELENFVKQLMVVVKGDTVRMEHIPAHYLAMEPPPEPRSEDRPSTPPVSVIQGPDLASMTWEEVERAYVLELLGRHRWNVTRAAMAAGLKRSTFDSRMKKLGIRKSV